MLNLMAASIFDLFVSVMSAKSIWSYLEKKYGVDDAGKKSMN